MISWYRGSILQFQFHINRRSILYNLRISLLVKPFCILFTGRQGGVWCESVCLTSDMDVGLHYTQIVSVWGKTITQKRVNRRAQAGSGVGRGGEGSLSSPCSCAGVHPFGEEAVAGNGCKYPVVTIWVKSTFLSLTHIFPFLNKYKWRCHSCFKQKHNQVIPQKWKYLC